MDSKQIFEHWSNWAETYGKNLRATTKTGTAKLLELDALARRLSLLDRTESADILEVGCGNGINCISLSKEFENFNFDGVDYIDKMISAAHDNLNEHQGLSQRVRFFQGDVLEIKAHSALKTEYDLVFTNRCLINLNSIALQLQAITALTSMIKPGGHLVMIENSLTTYAEQNKCRESLGLTPRTPAEFNLFFDEKSIREHLPTTGLSLLETEDFSSLHDIVLYALVPAINDGKIDYDHPIVHAATTLSRALAATSPGAFGAFGQNRLFFCQKIK